jgi:threonine dehydrogenase-like Zn-dependent dehydrogenase
VDGRSTSIRGLAKTTQFVYEMRNAGATSPMADTRSAVYLIGAGDLRFLERAAHDLADDEVRVAIACTGIRGTELHLYRGMQFYSTPAGPRPLGHAASGWLIEVGPAVRDLQVGDRVALIPGAPYRTCAQCRTGRPSVCSHRLGTRDGMWSRSVVAPAAVVHHLPNDISDQVGAAGVQLVGSTGSGAVDHPHPAAHFDRRRSANRRSRR